MSTTDDTNAARRGSESNDLLGPLLEWMRGLKTDHAPEGWPAVRMAQITALVDEIDRLRSAPRWWRCDTHGPATATAWGCPECVREMRASLGKARGLLIELDSVLRMAESHGDGMLTAQQVRNAVEPYLPLEGGPGPN